ncbi:MAG: ATP-dependent helicase [Candidatus Limnocylindrales bacterium]
MAVEIGVPQEPQAPPQSFGGPAPVPLGVVADLLKGLNREQRAAVTHRDGPLLVIAGPGTGKTEVVTRRAAWLIATKRARPREILALTFTDNAAEEMQARVDVLVPYGQADAQISTFHAFGDGLVREHAFELGLPGDVRLINRAEGIVLLREHLFELGLDRYRPLGDPTRFLGALVDLFQRAKDEDVSPADVADHAFRLPAISPAEIDIARARSELSTAYSRYQTLLAERGLIDHGDQVSLAVRLLRERPRVREAVTRRYRYLLVDEFQDMNSTQLELVHALTNPARNVTVVGDPDQAIYTFRGAGSDNIESFQERHADLRRVVLRRNYRSQQPIIDAAHRLIGHVSARTALVDRQVAHRRKRLASPVRSIWYGSPEEESDGVAAVIADLLAGGARPRDFAVLARSNAEIDSIARSLRVRGITVRTQLPSDFFAQSAVRPLLAYLRVIADPDQTLELYALASSPPYSLGGAQLTELLSLARRRHRSLWQMLGETTDREPEWEAPFRNAVTRLIEHVRAGVALSHERSSAEVLYDYVRRSGRLAHLVAEGEATDAHAVARFFDIVRSRARLLGHDRVQVLVPYLDTLIEAEDELADAGPLDIDAVSALTIHRAKGLEFGTVFLTGLTEGRFPARARSQTIDLPWAEIHGRFGNADPDRLDEERRLCFVAMTRARDTLWLSHHVSGPGGRGRRRPSPFIGEALDAPSTPAGIGLDAIGQIEALGAPAMEVLPNDVDRSIPGNFSYSELETYLDCPERYRLRHVVGLPTPTHHALTYGSAMHQAVAAFHLSCGRGQPLTEAELLEVFARGWSPEGFLSREHEEARFAAGTDALRTFHRDQMAAPSEVVAIERPFVFKLDQLNIRGRMDRVDRTADGAVIVDYKASNVRDQAKADDRARDSLQLQVYALAHEAEWGSLPHEVRLHFLDSGVVGAARPDEARLDKARTKLRSAAAGIREGKFEPRPNPTTCGYCPFRQVCSSNAA